MTTDSIEEKTVPITDTERLRFLIKHDAITEGITGIEYDRYDFAMQVMLDDNREELTFDDEVEGFRRMVDEAIRAENHPAKSPVHPIPGDV